MKNLNSKVVEKLKLSIPPIDLQIQFDQIHGKIQLIKERNAESLHQLQSLYAALSQSAFKGELDLSQVKVEMEESLAAEKKALPSIIPTEIATQTAFDSKAVIKQAGKRTPKMDIQNLSFQEYLGIPEETIKDHDQWIFSFTGMDTFYQFLLKDKFSRQAFSYRDIVESFASFFNQQGDKDFDHRKWKSIIYQYLNAKPPLLHQEFDEESGTVNLKLTDEAFKA